MSTLAAVWETITALLADGISVIPIRDKDDDNGVAKSPYGKSWKPFTKDIVTKDHLWKEMERFDTTAIGIICGTVSGNLEAIDLDEKYMPGISARLINDIKDLYPEIYERLRIHGTPSKGFHIIYRWDGPTEGNMKLAGRYASQDDLAKNPKTKTYNFLETRGENGYIAAPPSLGYTVVKDAPIPHLTVTERNAIINLCRSYTYITKSTEAPYKPTQADSNYYDTNPFEDFNNRCNPSELMQELGWTEYKHNNHFVWYTRPDKVKGVSMSFNIQRRFFYCFTASTELEENHGYTPANLVSTILHNGDKKQTFRYLVSKGYGKIKSQKEESLIKKAAINNKPLPPNISQDGVKLHAEISKQLVINHPYGIFWEDDTEKGMTINREHLYNVADGLGFKLYNDIQIARISDGIIKEQTQRDFFDTIKNYIKEEDADIYTRIANSYEAFIERHGKFTISRLQILDESKILSDTKKDCYKFYSNGMLHITEKGYELITPPTDKIIWSHKIHSRPFIQYDEGRYVDFLDKAIGLSEYLLACIGFLSHDYKDGDGYVIVLVEQCQNPKDGGGSGKNIFSRLFENTTTFFGKAGSQVKYDEKFMQAWNNEKIFCISDVLKNFSFDFLKEFVTGSATMKKLHVNEYSIPVSKMPKFLISTQFSYEVKDGGVRRRIRPIEFTDFFTKAGGVDVHYGDIHFPNEWTDKDWNGYDTTIATAIQQWLKWKRKIPVPTLTDGGWHKQFEQTYGRTINAIINEYWSQWVEDRFVSLETFKSNCDRYYNENNVAQKYKPSSFAFNEALAEYAEKMGVIYDKDATDRVQMAQIRGKSFVTK